MNSDDPRPTIFDQPAEPIRVTRAFLPKSFGKLLVTRTRIGPRPGPFVQGDIAKARKAFKEYQATRERDAVYVYLTVIFDIVNRWKRDHLVNKALDRVLALTRAPIRAIRGTEPYSVLIYCTADSTRIGTKARSKWSRVLRYAERAKPVTMTLSQFVKSYGGINECAAQATRRGDR